MEGVSGRAARFWYWVVVGIASAAFLFLTFQIVFGQRFGEIVHLLVVLVALGLLAYAHPQAMRHSCPQCGGVPDPVRSVEGRRLWACRACGWERARLRTRAQLEALRTEAPARPVTDH